MSDRDTQKKGGSRLEKKVKTPKTPKKPKKKRSRGAKIRLGIIIALLVILALMIGLFIAYRLWAKRPDLPSHNVEPGQNGGGSHAIDVDIPGLDSDRKDDFFTFLVVGRDTGGGGNTDTILLAAYDLANQKLNVMSIPRDTMVNIPHDIKRINGVYNYAGGGDEGIAALYKEVSQLVGFIPDYSIVVEWKAVGELVDAIGGVWFDVPRNMNYWDPTQNLRIQVSKGYQKLNGNDAMGVVRWRQNNDGTGYVTGDIGRIETQQAFLKAVVEQCLKIENVAKIQEFARVFTDNVQTDLTMGNLAWFAEQAIFGGLKMENVNFITLPGDYNGAAWCRYYQNYQSYVLPDPEELLKVVNENFNPYLEDRTADQLDIMTVNRDGSLSSSTGVVEDTPAASPPVRTTAPSSTPTPTPTPTPEPTDEPPASPSQTSTPANPDPTESAPPPTPTSGTGTEPTDPDNTPEPAPTGNEPDPDPTPQADPSPEATPWTPPPEVVAPSEESEFRQEE